jgi:hypothetical protein
VRSPKGKSGRTVFDVLEIGFSGDVSDEFRSGNALGASLMIFASSTLYALLDAEVFDVCWSPAGLEPKTDTIGLAWGTVEAGRELRLKIVLEDLAFWCEYADVGVVKAETFVLKLTGLGLVRGVLFDGVVGRRVLSLPDILAARGSVPAALTGCDDRDSQLSDSPFAFSTTNIGVPESSARSSVISAIPSSARIAPIVLACLHVSTLFKTASTEV